MTMFSCNLDYPVRIACTEHCSDPSVPLCGFAGWTPRFWDRSHLAPGFFMPLTGSSSSSSSLPTLGASAWVYLGEFGQAAGEFGVGAGSLDEAGGKEVQRH